MSAKRPTRVTKIPYREVIYSELYKLRRGQVWKYDHGLKAWTLLEVKRYDEDYGKKRVTGKAKGYSRGLRTRETPAEKAMEEILVSLDLKYNIQRVFYTGKSFYITDFELWEMIIEVDGVHHKLKKQREYDERRSEFLRKKGKTVLRFTNTQVLNDPETVKRKILKERDILAKTRRKRILRKLRSV